MTLSGIPVGSSVRSHRAALALGIAVAALAAPAPAQNCANTSVGFTPLNDLAQGTYQGFQGGLYPGGSNQRPPEHQSAGMQQAFLVLPRNSSGGIDLVNGKIGLIAVGMSNARIHFQRFAQLAMSDPLKSDQVVIVNSAQGGQPAEDIDDPAAPYWTFVAGEVQAAGLTPQQVQVVWMLEANRAPTAPFPEHAENLRDQFAEIVRITRSYYPRARLLYLGARIYAGYATTNLNPEPYAYEQGFSCKWLIEDQIQGVAGLNFDPSLGPVEAPWLAYGPYMWADGLVPRSDGLIWECSDLQADGTHPSFSGATKYAQALIAFFRNDTTTRGWYRGEVQPPGPFRADPDRSGALRSGGTISGPGLQRDAGDRRREAPADFHDHP
jgi:hypothetical protein